MGRKPRQKLKRPAKKLTRIRLGLGLSQNERRVSAYSRAMWLKAYLNFCRLAFNERFKPIKGYKPVRWLIVSIAFLVGTVLGDALGYSLLDLAKPVIRLQTPDHWLATVLFGVILFLLFLIDGARRYHDRVDKELKAENGKAVEELQSDRALRVRNVEELSMMAGRVEQTILLLSRDEEAALKMLTLLPEQLNRALYTCYGLSGESTFKGDWSYTTKLPDDRRERIDWLWNVKDRLADLIKDETPDDNLVVDRTDLPAEVFKA